MKIDDFKLDLNNKINALNEEKVSIFSRASEIENEIIDIKSILQKLE